MDTISKYLSVFVKDLNTLVHTICAIVVMYIAYRRLPCGKQSKEERLEEEPELEEEEYKSAEEENSVKMEVPSFMLD